MTKNVRIENADTSDHKLRVYAEEKNAAGEWVRLGAAYTHKLDHPTALLVQTVWQGRRIVIEEAPPLPTGD